MYHQVVLDAKPQPSVRERTRRAVQAELIDLAIELFLTHGYEATTVAHIAAAANMSSRTFFRYFASKEDLLAQSIVDAGATAEAALRARPMTEAPWEALRRAFDPVMARLTNDGRAFAVTRMTLESPDMAPCHMHRTATCSRSLAQHLMTRLPADRPDPERRLQAEAMSSAALSCLLVAQRAWVAGGGQDSLATLLDVSMGALSPLSG